MQVAQKLIHRLALCGATGNGRHFGPEAALVCLVHDNLDLHTILPVARRKIGAHAGNAKAELQLYRTAMHVPRARSAPSPNQTPACRGLVPSWSGRRGQARGRGGGGGGGVGRMPHGRSLPQRPPPVYLLGLPPPPLGGGGGGGGERARMNLVACPLPIPPP